MRGDGGESSLTCVLLHHLTDTRVRQPATAKRVGMVVGACAISGTAVGFLGMCSERYRTALIVRGEGIRFF